MSACLLPFSLDFNVRFFMYDILLQSLSCEVFFMENFSYSAGKMGEKWWYKKKRRKIMVLMGQRNHLHIFSIRIIFFSSCYTYSRVFSYYFNRKKLFFFILLLGKKKNFVWMKKHEIFLSCFLCISTFFHIAFNNT